MLSLKVFLKMLYRVVTFSERRQGVNVDVSPFVKSSFVCDVKKKLISNADPFCDRSACFPLLQTDMCKEYGSNLPVQRGTMEICGPGFVSARCCPN